MTIIEDQNLDILIFGWAEKFQLKKKYIYSRLEARSHSIFQPILLKTLCRALPYIFNVLGIVSGQYYQVL
jgi:hypothetical protein